MRALVLEVLILLCAQSAFAKANLALQQSLESSAHQSDLAYEQSAPYRMDVDFVLQINSPVKGHLTLEWAAKNRWRREIEAGDFQQSEVKDGEYRYVQRNMGFTPLAVQDLISLLDFAAELGDATAKRQKQRVENGVALNCIEAFPRGSGKDSHEVCFDPTSGEIDSDNWRGPLDARIVTRFSGYFNFGNHRFPRDLERYEEGSEIVAAKVVNLTPASFPDSEFSPPEGAVRRHECDDLVEPVLLTAPPLNFPPSMSEHTNGALAVAMTILADGSVTAIQFAGSNGIKLDPQTKQTLQAYRFKPAMCGKVPVIYDLTIWVSFTKY